MYKFDSYKELLSLIEKASGNTRDDLIAMAMPKYGWSVEWVKFHLAQRAGIKAPKPQLADEYLSLASAS